MAVLFLTKEQFIVDFEAKLSKKEIAGCQPGTTFTIDEDQICLLPDKKVMASKPVVVKEPKPTEKEKKAEKEKKGKKVVSKKDTPKKERAPRKSKAAPDPTENQWFTGLFGN